MEEFYLDQDFNPSSLVEQKYKNHFGVRFSMYYKSLPTHWQKEAHNERHFKNVLFNICLPESKYYLT